MHILIYFLFHNQNDARIFCFVIVWDRQFDCDVAGKVMVWRSLNFMFYTYFHFLKDTESCWTNLGDKIMSFIAIVNGFKGWDAVFYMLDKWMVDPLIFLICIVMKLLCEFISFLWNRVMNSGKVLLCDNNVHVYYIATCIAF
jgi:hypothetical protein